MGLGATQSYLYSLTKSHFNKIVRSPQEQITYNRIIKETKAKLGSNYTAQHGKICSLLASNPNVTVEDVEKVFGQRYGLGMQSGQVSFDNYQNDVADLEKFEIALNKVPGYSKIKTNITADQMVELLQMWNLTQTTIMSGKTREQTFISQAKTYINELIQNSNKTDNSTEEKTSDNNVPELKGIELDAAINKSLLIFSNKKQR